MSRSPKRDREVDASPEIQEGMDVQGEPVLKKQSLSKEGSKLVALLPPEDAQEVLSAAKRLGAESRKRINSQDSRRKGVR